MSGYLRRLATTGAAYTAASILSKLIAVALLPLYTRYLTTADYGAAEVMFAAVVSASIVVRFGLIEAVLRFYYKDGEDPAKVVATSFAALFWLSTVAALIALPFAAPISEALLGEEGARLASGPELARIAIGGLWVLTMVEYLLTLFRLEERARAYFVTTIVNVLAAIGLTVVLVVGRDEGARGLLLGSYLSGAAVALGLIAIHWRRLSLRVDRPLLRRMTRFGLPTMPAELSLYGLNFVDRIVIARSLGLAEAGLYSLAVKFAQAVNVLVRGFQLAWPPLAYSIRDDGEARRAYAAIVTWFVGGCAFVVTGMWLFSRWIVRILAAPQFFDSYEAIGLIATGVTLYALYMVLVVILGRTGRTEFNFPATIAALVDQRHPQRHPRAAAGHRRRRPRPRRLLPRRSRPDVRLHPAPLPRPLRMDPPRPHRAHRDRPRPARRTTPPNQRHRRLPAPHRLLVAVPSSTPPQRLLHPGGAQLAPASPSSRRARGRPSFYRGSSRSGRRRHP